MKDKRHVVSRGPLSRPSHPKAPRTTRAGVLAQLKASVLPSDRRSKENKSKISIAERMEETRKKFEDWSEADRAQIERELDDLRFYALDQWPEDVKKARMGQNANGGLPPVPARPCLVLDKTRESVSQVLNEEREADLGIEITPADDFEGLIGPVDESEIELREGLVRRIQRESQAANARSWAFERAVVAGRGFYGVMTRYVKGKTNDQELYVMGFFNQACVTLDPSHEEPDGSDAEGAFVGVWMSWSEYQDRWPDAENARNVVSGLSDEHFVALGNEAPNWFKSEGKRRMVYVVDHYYTVRSYRELADLPDGSVAWVEELTPEQKASVTKDDIRRVEDKQIRWEKLDGANPEPLEETDWLGPDIPIVKVTGEQLQPYDSDRRAQGLIRPARDSQQGFNAMASKMVEVVALQAIPSTMMASGQDEGFTEEWDLSTTRTLGRLHYNQVDSDGRPAPPPSAVPKEAPIQAISAALGMFDQAIQTTMRTHDPSVGKSDPSLRSSKQIKTMVAQSQRSTSNFMSNLQRSVRREAQILNNLLYPVYHTRTSAMLQKMARIQPSGNGQPQPTYALTPDANFNVALKVTRNLDTRRQEEAEFLSGLVQAEPQMMMIYGDLLYKNLDVPGHQELSERAEIMLDPKVQQAIAAKKNGTAPIPPEVQAQLSLAHQTIQKAQEEIQQLTMEKQAKTQQTEAQTGIAAIKANVDLEITRMNNETKIAVAELGAKVDRLALFMEERGRLGIQAHEAAMAQGDATHEQNMQTQDVAGQAALAEQGQGHALEQGQQAAALAPEPAQGETA